MKKILLLLFVLFLYLQVSFGQGVKSTILSMPDSTSQFGQPQPNGTLILDRQSHKIWQLTASALATNSIATSSKILTVANAVSVSDSSWVTVTADTVITSVIKNTNGELNVIYDNSGYSTFEVDVDGIYSYAKSNGGNYFSATADGSISSTDSASNSTYYTFNVDGIGGMYVKNRLTQDTTILIDTNNLYLPHLQYDATQDTILSYNPTTGRVTTKVISSSVIDSTVVKTTNMLSTLSYQYNGSSENYFLLSKNSSAYNGVNNSLFFDTENCHSYNGHDSVKIIHSDNSSIYSVGANSKGLLISNSSYSTINSLGSSSNLRAKIINSDSCTIKDGAEGSYINHSTNSIIKNGSINNNIDNGNWDTITNEPTISNSGSKNNNLYGCDSLSIASSLYSSYINVNDTLLRNIHNSTVIGEQVVFTDMSYDATQDSLLVYNPTNGKVTTRAVSTISTDTTSLSNRINQKWSKTGDALSDSTTQYLGSSNGYPLIFRTNNVERMRIAGGTGNVGIGKAPSTGNKLDVNGDIQLNGNVFKFNATAGCKMQMAGNTLDIMASFNRILYSNATGIGLLGSTNVTQGLHLYGNVDEVFDVDRHSIASTAGKSLTITGGGAASSGNNVNGGNLIFIGGIKTGTFSNSSIKMQAYGSNAAKTSDNTAYDRVVVMSSENLFDNQLDTLFRVTLGDDSTFTGSLNYNVIVSDNDSAQVEKGAVNFIYIRRGSTDLTSATPVIAQVLQLGTLSTAFSFIYNEANKYVYVCVTANSTTHEGLKTIGNITFNATLLGAGGRYSTFTEF